MDRGRLDATPTASLRSKTLRIATIAALSQFAAACVVPNSMHLTQGVTPQKLDTNVRFQTTYYFRAFDYCWSADAAVGSSRYRLIVPETDTLYRYRMTGKASALGNQIKFESGTLTKEQIDPFGTDVTYNKDIDGYVYRSQDEAKRQAEDAATARAAEVARTAALERFQALADMLVATENDQTLSRAEKDELKTELRAGMRTALQRYIGTLDTAMDPSVKRLVDALDARVKALEARAVPSSDLTTLKADVEQLKTDVAGLQAEYVKKGLADACSIGEFRRRGFQIMGPEGMRPFDQDSRLLMAMHSSAKPLIETLSEYSSRLLKPRINVSDQLLPLAQETTVVVRTQRVLDRVLIDSAKADATPPAVGSIFDQAIKEFGGSAK